MNLTLIKKLRARFSVQKADAKRRGPKMLEQEIEIMILLLGDLHQVLHHSMVTDGISMASQ